MEPLKVYNECKQQYQIPLHPPIPHIIQQIHSFSRYLLNMYNQPVTVLGTGDTVGNFFNFYFFWWLLRMSKCYAYGAVAISNFDIVY